jgi:hypothetical protein
MASAVTAQKFIANNAVSMYDLDPDATSATDVGWVDMQGYETFTVVAMLSVEGTSGNPSAMTIVANSNSAGTGDEAVIVSHADPTDCDAVGDWVVLECNAEQIAHEGRENGYALRYVSAKIALDAADAEMVVTYIRGGAKYPQLDLTADYAS